MTPCLPCPSTPRAALVLALAALVAVLGGCASSPLPDDPRTPPLVTRTANSTVWSTPEAAAAAEALANAPRPSPARPGTSTATRPAAAEAAGRTAPAAAGPTPAPAPAAPAVAAPPNAGMVFFEFDSYDVADSFQAVLEGHARALRAQPGRRIVIEGHADDRGGSEYNLALGQKRAEAVFKVLALMGVTAQQVEAVSFGDTRPVDAARTPEAWAKNRRAEIKEL